MKRSIKLSAVGIAVWAALLAGAGLRPVGAAIILQDDFTGPAGPPSAQWSTVVGGVALDGVGNVELADEPDPAAYMFPSAVTYGFAPSAGLMGRMTLTGYTETGGNITFGLTDSLAAGAAISLRNELVGNYALFLENGADNSLFDTGVGHSDGDGDWVIDWFMGRVVVSRNGTVILDTSVDSPTTSTTGGWTFPSIPLTPSFLVFGDGFFEVDAVTWESLEVVPEPSSMVLLGIGGWLLWRKRRVVGA